MILYNYLGLMLYLLQQKMRSPILSKRVESLKNLKPNQKGGREMNILLEQYRQKALKEGMEKDSVHLGSFIS